MAKATPLARSTAKAIETSNKTLFLIPNSPFSSEAEERRVSNPRPVT
jgi:hypothetical protein